MTRVPHSSAAIPGNRRAASHKARAVSRPRVTQVHTLLRACVLLAPAVVLPSAAWGGGGVAHGAVVAACCALLALWRAVKVMA
jgi:hypothetical protein